MGGFLRDCISSDVKTATDAAIVISTTAGNLMAVQMVVNTTSDPTVIIYDNNSTRTGAIIYKRKIDSSVEGLGRFDSFPDSVVFSSGCVLSVTGTDGADEAIVFYTKRV